jgi:Spy/CpxP family protein refolding chaperone
MKKYLFSLSLLVAVTGATIAAPFASAANQQTRQDEPQGRPAGKARPKGGPHGQADLAKELNLSGKQKTQVEAIQKEQRQKMEALHKGAGAEGDREKRMADMRRLDDETDAKLKSVLSAEQYAQYQTQKQQRPQGLREGGKGQQGGPRGQRPSSAN